MTRSVESFLDHPPTYWGLVEYAADSWGDAVLFEDEHGRSLTFTGYRDAAERVAAGLFARGIGPGSIVGWQLPTCIDTAVLLAALARLGAVQSPIIPILREREVTYITRESRCELLIVRPQWRGHDFEKMVTAIADEIGFEVLATDELPTGDPSTLPPPPGPEAVARWLYWTSGSTSDPKGVWHTDASVMCGMNGVVAGVVPTRDDVYPVAFPLAHIGGVNMIGAFLTCGYRSLLMESFDPERSPLLMSERGATMLGTALPFFRAYIAAQVAHGPEPLFPGLRACISGGAPKPAGLQEEIKRVLGGIGVCGSWGLTEFPVASHASLDDDDEALSATEGRPAPFVEIRVVGLDGEEKGPGEEGELRVRGPQMFQGYANPDLNADAFDDQGSSAPAISARRVPRGTSPSPGA